MNGAGLFFLLLLLLVIIPAAAWIGYTRWRAHAAGLPPPPLSAYNPFKRQPSSNYPISPRPSNPLTWVQDKWASLRDGGSSGSGAGGRSRGRSGRGGFGPLDPDGAWDDRVGAEADAYGPVGGDVEYEEQELGLHPPTGQQHGYLPEYGEEAGRGRSRSRDEGERIGGGQRGLDERYDEEMRGERANPFGDHAEAGSSVRGISPRPVDDGKERKSMFREAM